MTLRQFFTGRATVFLVLLGMLGIVAAFSLLNAFIYKEKQGDGTVIEPYRATLSGEYVCLPHKDAAGAHTDECAFGLKTDVGEYYAVTLALMSQQHRPLSVGERFSANGLVTPVERLNAAQWRSYAIAGLFSVTDSLQAGSVAVAPVTHAAMVLTWDGVTIYNDPTGDASAYAAHAPADIVLVSDIHGDHFSAAVLEAVVRPDTALIAPQAVIDLLPASLAGRATLLANGSATQQDGITVTAIPMYNLPETADSRHVKGRGNGYVLEKDGFRVYVAGDTSGIPEMRELRDIGMAFVPMNGPTMSVEEAADAVLAFAPRQVYPYHYRSQGGFSDVGEFKRIVNERNEAIDVVLLDWYPPAE